MKHYLTVTTSLLSIVGLFGITALSAKAQSTSSERDLSNQTQLLEGLEGRNQSDWQFPVDRQSEPLVEDTEEVGELNTSEEEEDVELVEIDEGFRNWETHGDDEDYGVQFDVYDF